MGTGKHFGLSSDKANKPKKERNFREISWRQCQCGGSSQIPSQNDLNDYHHYLSLYKVMQNNHRTELIIYDTENEKEDVKILDTKLIDQSTSITQLPNGELFCYGSTKSGIALIIDRDYRIRVLPSGTNCSWSSALYFDNNVYCFGGFNEAGATALSRKFDLKKNWWINLTSLLEPNGYCTSVIFNGNILISGYGYNLWLYSIDIDSFSMISYDFTFNLRRVLINVGRLYLIEWGYNGLIYESEDEYHWKRISKSEDLFAGYQMYCLYNKEKIYISTWDKYYKFDLKKKVVLEIK